MSDNAMPDSDPAKAGRRMQKLAAEIMHVIAKYPMDLDETIKSVAVVVGVLAVQAKDCTPEQAISGAMTVARGIVTGELLLPGYPRPN